MQLTHLMLLECYERIVSETEEYILSELEPFNKRWFGSLFNLFYFCKNIMVIFINNSAYV